MKLGDKVSCAFNFDILARINDAFKCIQSDGHIEFYVPIYLSALGIRFPMNSFVFPGDTLPPNHPDYYRRLEIKDKKAVYLDRHGNKVHLSLGPSYNENGAYHVSYVDIKGGLYRNAQLMTEEHMERIIAEFIDMRNVDGGAIAGTLVRIYIYTIDKGVDGEVSKGIMYFDDTEEAELYESASNIFCIIHDWGTYVEYPLPLKLIKKI